MKKHMILYSLIPILGLALAAAPVQAAPRNLVMAECTSCTTVAAFQDYAQSDIPSGAYYVNSAGTPHVEALFNVYIQSPKRHGRLHWAERRMPLDGRWRALQLEL